MGFWNSDMANEAKAELDRVTAERPAADADSMLKHSQAVTKAQDAYRDALVDPELPKSKWQK